MWLSKLALLALVSLAGLPIYSSIECAQSAPRFGIFGCNKSSAHCSALSGSAQDWAEEQTDGLPARFYAFGPYLFAGTSAGVLRSINDGQNWEEVNTGLNPGTKVQAFASIGANLFIGTDQGVWVSANLGEEWQPLNAGLPETPASRSVIKLDTDQSALYAEIAADSSGGINRIFRISDQGQGIIGQQWTEVGLDFPASPGALLIAVDERTIYAKGSSGVYRSIDDGEEWAPFDLGEFSSATLRISGPVIFAGRSDGLWRSTDRGSSWTQVREYAPGGSTGSELVNCEVSGVNVYVISRSRVSPSATFGQFMYSPDLGDTWFDTGAPTGSGPVPLSYFSVQVTGNRVIAVRTDFRLWINTSLNTQISAVSAASYNPFSVADESMAAVFGAGFSAAEQSAGTIPLPTDLANTTVTVTDSAGVERVAPLFYVSPGQINFQIPAGSAEGLATVTVRSDGQIVGTSGAVVEPIAPGLFSANASGRGVAAAVALRVKADGTQTFEPVAKFDQAGNQFVAMPIDLGPESDQLFLILFGTGIRSRNGLNGEVRVRIGGVNAHVTYAREQGSFVGLDQINVLLPRSLAGRGEVDVVVDVGGRPANIVRVSIK